MSKKPDPPEAMFRNNREIDAEFHANEYLLRRVPTKLWETPEDDLDIEAIKLPDMSVGRSKYGHPEWVRFDNKNNSFYNNAGIIGFKVCEVPEMIDDEGTRVLTFSPYHKPLDKDYPHSEICAFEGAIHIEDVPEAAHLKWRELLLRKLAKIIQPRQKVKIRDVPPRSHELEPVELATNS